MSTNNKLFHTSRYFFGWGELGFFAKKNNELLNTYAFNFKVYC